MNVTVCSAFRDATGYLDRYLDQVETLRDALHHRNDDLAVVWGEGDSCDTTYIALDYELLMGRFRGRLVDVTHGGPVYGPVVDKQRFRQLAFVANTMWACIPPETDVLLQVESDLIWEADTLLEMVDRVEAQTVIAPMVMDGPDSFYDIFAHRKDGVQFSKQRPFYPGLNGHMVEMDSAGSCLAMPGALARTLHCPPEDVLVGVCNQIRQQGGRILLATDLEVWHES